MTALLRISGSSGCVPSTLRWNQQLAVLVVIICVVSTGRDVTASSQTDRTASSATGGGKLCRFPEEWRGRYFQSGLREIVIRDRHFSTKGTCIERDRDYFLLYNRVESCYHCLLLLRQHTNIIQYKEKPATTVRCPFNGAAYYFAYNDLVHGSCPQALSYAQPCAGHTRYQLRFNHCTQHALFNGKDLGLDCLATWKDGSETYVYGRFTGHGIDDDKEQKYRCFKYQHYGSELAVAMSADATCRGLRSATDGPFLMDFTRDNAGWPDQSCQFPDWLSDVRWRDLDGQSRYSVDDESMTLSMHTVMSPKHQPISERSEYRCRQKTTLGSDNEVIVYTFAIHGCVAKYQCLKFRRLAEHAVEFYQGSMVDHDASFRCQADVYDNVKLLIPDPRDQQTVPLTACPRPGVHHTTPSEGCIHRLTVGCHNESIIDIDHSCSVAGQQGVSLECLVTWSDVSCTSYVIARHKHAHVIDCFSFRREGELTLFGPDSHCSGINNASRRHDVLQYNILRNDNCRRDPRLSVNSAVNPTSGPLRPSTPSPRRSQLSTTSPPAAARLPHHRPPSATTARPRRQQQSTTLPPVSSPLPFDVLYDGFDDAEDLDDRGDARRQKIRFAGDSDDDDDDDWDEDLDDGAPSGRIPPSTSGGDKAKSTQRSPGTGSSNSDRRAIDRQPPPKQLPVEAVVTSRFPVATSPAATAGRGHTRHVVLPSVTSSPSSAGKPRRVVPSNGSISLTTTASIATTLTLAFLCTVTITTSALFGQSVSCTL